MKPSAIIIFLPTSLATECGITNKKDADELFMSVMWSVKKLSIECEYYTDGLYLSVIKTVKSSSVDS